MVALVCVALVGIDTNHVAFAEDKKAKVEAQQKRYEELERKRRALSQKKQKNLQQAQKFTRKIIQNQRRLDSARRNLRYQQNRLRYMNAELQNLSSELDSTEEAAKQLSQDADARLKRIYMSGRVNMMQMILESPNLTTFLDRLYYKQQFVIHDRELLNSLREKKQSIETQRREIASQQNLIYGTIDNIKVAKQNYDRYINQDRKQRAKYRKDAQFYERAERELLGESRNIQREIEKLTGKKIVKDVKSTGKMMWPCTGRISSRFGYRFHPIHRKQIMHTGLDIARDHGVKVVAADSGKVIQAGWRGGYGKVVMISHGTQGGKSIVTLYGHLSKTAVRKGQSVNKGQYIGNIGSTGYSTGPHLHFEVRRNGKPVNPSPYLP